MRRDRKNALDLESQNDRLFCRLDCEARWLSGRAFGLRTERSGIRNLPPPCCVLEQDTLLPQSTGNTQEAVATSRHD